MSNDLEKLCPTFLQTPNEAGIIAFLFNGFMSLEARNEVPDDVALEIGRYMHSKGYSVVFNKFYKQREEIASGSHAVQSDAANERALEALKEFTNAWKACCGLPDTRRELDRLGRVFEKAERALDEIKAAKAAKVAA